MTQEIHDSVKDQVHDLFCKYKAALIKNVITIAVSILAILVTINIFLFASIDAKFDKIMVIAINDAKQEMRINMIDATLFRHDNQILNNTENIKTLERTVNKIEAILPKQSKHDFSNE